MNSLVAAEEPFLNIPNTISREAQAFLRTLKDPALNPPFPEVDNIEGWKKLQAGAEAKAIKMFEPIVNRFEHTVRERNVGGVPALEVSPMGLEDSDKVIVYTHGGAHVMFSARSTLGRAVVLAHATGVRLISVD